MIFIVRREKPRKKAIRHKKRFRWRAKRRTENNAAARSGKFPSGAAAREINKKRRAASPFFRIFGYYPLFASVSAVRARKRRDHSPHLQTVSSSETEDSLPRIPHRAVRQPCSPFPMRFCDPPHYSRMRSHTVPDPSLFSCSALYLPKPRESLRKDEATTISKTPAMLYVSVPKSRN